MVPSTSVPRCEIDVEVRRLSDDPCELCDIAGRPHDVYETSNFDVECRLFRDGPIDVGVLTGSHRTVKQKSHKVVTFRLFGEKPPLHRLKPNFAWYGSSHRRNHVCKVSNFQVLRFYRGSNFTGSYWFYMGLITVQSDCAACDKVSLNVSRMNVRRHFSVNELSICSYLEME